MTLTAAQLLQFSLGAVLIILLPGPNSLFVMTTAAKIGRAAGWRAAAGVFLGDGILMICAVLGAGALLSGGGVVFRALTLAGALYLAWLAIGLFRNAAAQLRSSHTRAASAAEEPTAATMADARYSPLRRSLATSLLNPKAILFFAAFFVQFVQPSDPHLWANFAVLVVIMQAISMSYLGIVIEVSHRLGHRLKAKPRVVALANAAAGTAFILFAVKLALASA